MAKTDEALATANIVNGVFPQAVLETAQLLTPKVAFGTWEFKTREAPALARRLTCEVGCVATRLVEKVDKGNAILVVGHQPILGWLAHGLVQGSHPLAPSEVLCLDLEGHDPRGLRWTVSPSNPEAVEEFKEKIRSKMDVAKLLSSFLGGGLSFLLGTMANARAAKALGDHIWAFGLGSVCLLGALVCFLWTMCSYDTLVMPHRMWTETPTASSARPTWVVARPPSPVHWILYQNMVRIWEWQFLPATGLMLAGLWLLASAVFGAQLFSSTNPVPYYCFLAVLVMTCLAGIVLRHWRSLMSALRCRGAASKVRHLCGPWLGSED